MLDRVRESIESLLGSVSGAQILVGYSGGADSTALLHGLHAIGCPVVAAHLNHGQRPEGSEELDRCVQFCEARGIPIVTAVGDIPRMASELKIGIEEAGRRARYGFFEQAAQQTDCVWIATGHTRDDHIESVLLNLARGTGIKGLGGIPLRRDNIIRPLRSVTREETRAYCDAHNLWYHDDPCNFDAMFARVRLRQRVVPEFASIHPGALDAIVRLADIATEEDQFLDSMAAAALERIEVHSNGDLHFLTQDCEALFDREGMAILPNPLLKRGIRLVGQILGGGVDYAQAVRIAEAIRSQTDGSETLEGGDVTVEWSGGIVHFRELKTDSLARFPLQVPGITESTVFGWEIDVTVGKPQAKNSNRTDLEIQISLANVRPPLSIRPYESGDRMDPIGFDGTRKLSDLLSEARLTSAARLRLPIIQDMAGIIWVPGVCVSNRVKLAASEEQALKLRFGPTRTSLSGQEVTMSPYEA